MRKAALGIAPAVAAIGVAAIAAASALPGTGGGARIEHAPAAATAAADVSSNWAGYVATGPGSTTTTASTSMAYTDVTGQWRQPKATCTPGSSTSAAVWVGLGGYSESSNALEQTGTSADCDTNGRATYYAWYELVPANSVTLRLKIFPGDVITSSVVVNGTDVLVQVKDRTRRATFTKHLTMASPDLTSAEWIAEAPALCGSNGACRDLALTNFGSVTFTRTFAKGNNIGGTISSPTWTSTAIQLVPRSHRFFGGNDPYAGAGAAGAAPTGLAPDGSGFTVNWQASPSAS